MRIGHISDLHILSLKNAKLYQFINKRIIGGTNLLLNRGNQYKIEFVEKLIDDINTQNLDFLVITGDITNLALKSEFKKAVSLLENIKLPKNKIMMIPGNHDNYVKSSYNNKLFENYMNPWLINDIKLKTKERWPIFRILDDIIITGFSSSIPSCLLCSSGKISNSQLEIFDEVLNENKNKFNIVLLHHHLPKLNNRKRYLSALRNRNQVLEYLSKHKVNMVLHGHNHKNNQYSVNYNNYNLKIYEAGASARLSNNHQGNWSIYEIKNKNLKNIERRFLDYKTQEFIKK